MYDPAETGGGAAVIRRFAPAKINLFLYVTGRRGDGYHTLFSCFLPLTYGDELTFAFGGPPGIRIECNEPELAQEDNLAVRAVKRYCEKFDLPPACRIVLRKNIFCAAGLGGGSSDAAAALLACEKHYGRGGKDALEKLALGLGADVPFFLAPRPALATGIGEELRPLDWKVPLSVLLINPRFPVSTADAYRHCRIAEAPELPEDWLLFPERFAVNTLAEGLWKKFPLLGILKEELSLAGADAAGISGSGPTLFGLFRRKDACAESAEKMRRTFGDAVKVAETEVLL